MIDYRLRTRIVAGEGAIERLGALARELGVQRALIVSDPGVVEAGLYGTGIQSLRAAGLEFCGFHGLCENPTTEHVDNGLEVARDFSPDLIVGLGGGSSMDCAKGINFLYSCGGKIADYWGVGKATQPMLPLIAIPTTAGTGSETQSFALISDAKTHVKMACGDPKAAAAVAILDPLLTLTQPPRVTALTGIDALTHALETYVTNKRNAVSECFSREAWTLLSRGFPRVIEDPTDLAGRTQMQLGAAFAGMAIEASMLGAAHALANPLTAFLGVAHGQAVGLMMPFVVRFNRDVVEHRYRELAHLLPGISYEDRRSGSEIIADRFTDWLQLAGLCTRLGQLENWNDSPQIENQISAMADMASKQWTGAFNPRTATVDDYSHMYRSAV
ncbi:MAG: iron-containing alcohol dehydrogenase [Pirellula sp.]|nr:iron-containing alcohol dehydrogenase [Pirellula sp.]